MPVLAAPHARAAALGLSDDDRSRIQQHFQENFTVRKRLTKKEEAKILQEKIAKERATLDPLGLVERQEKKKKEKLKMKAQVDRFRHALLQKENEQKFGVDMFTAFQRSSQKQSMSSHKLEKLSLEQSLSDGQKRIRQESLRLHLDVKNQFAANKWDGMNGNREAYQLRLKHCKYMRDNSRSWARNTRSNFRSTSEGFRSSKSMEFPQERSVYEDSSSSSKRTSALDESDDEDEDLALVHGFLDFLIDQGRNLSDSFKVIDTNSTGELTRCEFMDGLIRMRYPGTKSTIDAIFSLLDIDKDGEIQWEEYSKLEPYYQRRKEKKAKMKNRFSLPPLHTNSGFAL